ncbi:hypothetical protein NPX99_06465 [Bartonella sp. 220]|uniref:hypothetical protein n=1 Tax=Bartonella sp. 220B TaxID=2967260 RepID=UPI0022A8DCBE|nr:hypothetical protein [Bartonella sp. 220B]MCZ2158911.1 hypothetical protein [Bartonella sp. 220B]
MAIESALDAVSFASPATLEAVSAVLLASFAVVRASVLLAVAASDALLTDSTISLR